MSRFYCPIARVESLRYLGDSIAVATVDGCEIIVPKDQWRVGDLGAVIPPGALLPNDLAASLRGRAKLFGERRNRVRVFKLLGQMSEGLLLGPLPGGQEGADVSLVLGIKKYEPHPPPHMRGECDEMAGLTVPYDIENFRRNRRVLFGGEQVEITEKVHGSLCAITIIPGLGNPRFLCGDTLVYSKGLASSGLSFTDSEGNRENLYLSTVKRLGLRETIISAFGYTEVTVFGEIFGPGVQDLTYSIREPGFNIFDVWIGSPQRGRFIDRETLAIVAGLPRVPALFRGPFDAKMLTELASGRTVLGRNSHLREGVVVTPWRERRHPRIGRVILKYVSPEYLTRASGTEYH